MNDMVFVCAQLYRHQQQEQQAECVLSSVGDDDGGCDKKMPGLQ